MKLLRVCGLALLLSGSVGIGTAVFIYSGVYNIGADDPHTPFVYWLVESLRDRSITARATSLRVPRLDDAEFIASGGADYAEMCAECHLQPGIKTSEISAGLYPPPPTLTEKSDLTPAEMFWVIKHGIKMSGMPAWGLTHDDQRIWAMVAFLQQLPALTAEQYQILTAPEPGASEHHAAKNPD